MGQGIVTLAKNGQADSINSESQGAYIICDNANFAMLKSFLSVKEEYFFPVFKIQNKPIPHRKTSKDVSIIMQTKINPQTPKQCQLVNSITSNQAYISSHSPSSSSFSGTGGSFLAKTLRSSGQVELSFSQGRMQSRSKR